MGNLKIECGEWYMCEIEGSHDEVITKPLKKTKGAWNDGYFDLVYHIKPLYKMVKE